VSLLVKNLAFVVLTILMALAALAYAVAMRRWMGRLREVAQENPTPEAHAAFMATDEYRRLRQAARLPVYAATLLFLALFLLMRYG